MRPVATVLYEDKMQVGGRGAFPPHDFLLAMVADHTGLRVFDLARLVEKNPRKGVGNVIADVARTGRIAGAGMLCILVDRDRVAEHLRLPTNASEAAIIAALNDLSDAPDKLSVHFLDPNMEGLLLAIEACAPKERAPTIKDHNARDLFLKRAAYTLASSVRDCVRGKQPSLGALAALLAGLCPGGGV